MSNTTELNLLGKDYFTEKEAAHYACVSVRQLQNKAILYGIQHTVFMGKKVYTRRSIANAIESQFAMAKR